MSRKIHLEGSLEVEMKNGERYILTCTPFAGKVYHKAPGMGAFGETLVTDEIEFRQNMRRVVSRSSYDKR